LFGIVLYVLTVLSFQSAKRGTVFIKTVPLSPFYQGKQPGFEFSRISFSFDKNSYWIYDIGKSVNYYQVSVYLSL